MTQLQPREMTAAEAARATRELIEYCYAQGWSDGLPVVPPIREFVDEFLARGGLPLCAMVVRALGKELILDVDSGNAGANELAHGASVEDRLLNSSARGSVSGLSRPCRISSSSTPPSLPP